jgi:hypothetical protein
LSFALFKVEKSAFWLFCWRCHIEDIQHEKASQTFFSSPKVKKDFLSTHTQYIYIYIKREKRILTGEKVVRVTYVMEKDIMLLNVLEKEKEEIK